MLLEGLRVSELRGPQVRVCFFFPLVFFLRESIILRHVGLHKWSNTARCRGAITWMGPGTSTTSSAPSRPSSSALCSPKLDVFVCFSSFWEEGGRVAPDEILCGRGSRQAQGACCCIQASVQTRFSVFDAFPDLINARAISIMFEPCRRKPAMDSLEDCSQWNVRDTPGARFHSCQARACPPTSLL